MEHTRIVVVGRHRMLRELIHELVERQPRFEVVRELDSAAGLLGVVESDAPHIVIAGEGDAPAAAVAALLDRFPRMRAIAIEDDGRHGVLYELVPRREQLDALSPTTLRAALTPAPRPDWLP